MRSRGRGRLTEVAERGATAGAAASRQWVLWSILGIAWGCAHVLSEALMGLGLAKVGVPLTLAWAALLVVAVRGQPWAVYGAVVVGTLGCYQLALIHFIRLNMRVDWFFVLPWMTYAEATTDPAWVFAYNILVYAGVIIGVATLWTGARALGLGPGLRGMWLPAILGALLVLEERWRMAQPEGPKGPAATASAYGIGLFAFGTMFVAGQWCARGNAPRDGRTGRVGVPRAARTDV